jgi:hypothetical protein
MLAWSGASPVGFPDDAGTDHDGQRLLAPTQREEQAFDAFDRV